MKEVAGIFSGIETILKGALTVDSDTISNGAKQVGREMVYTEISVYMHCFLHIPTVQSVEVSELIYDKHVVHHGLAAKVVEYFSDVIQSTVKDELDNVNHLWSIKLVNAIQIQHFRGFVASDLFDTLKQSVSFNHIDNVCKVIFQQFVNAAKILFPKLKGCPCIKLL